MNRTYSSLKVQITLEETSQKLEYNEFIMHLFGWSDCVKEN